MTLLAELPSTMVSLSSALVRKAVSNSGSSATPGDLDGETTDTFALQILERMSLVFAEST